MGFSLAAGAACVTMLRRAFDLQPNYSIGLKWPNDLFVLSPGGVRKLGGILIETESRSDSETLVATGVGVNLRRQEWPPEIEAISLDEISLSVPSLARAAALLIGAVVEAGERFLLRGLSDVRQEWRSLSLFSGQRMMLQLPDRVARGIEAGVEEDGALVLEEEGGLAGRYYCGELRYLPA
jgi:BirA family biotin operon repressor/biotin-[acetyl-CoA-carboxylase] ligase